MPGADHRIGGLRGRSHREKHGKHEASPPRLEQLDTVGALVGAWCHRLPLRQGDSYLVAQKLVDV
jgi:hypothetical protein